MQQLAKPPSSFTYTAIREGLYVESTPIYTAFFNPKDVTSADENANGEIEILIPHDGKGSGIAWVGREVKDLRASGWFRA